jgi:hypothetical protein
VVSNFFWKICALLLLLLLIIIIIIIIIVDTHRLGTLYYFRLTLIISHATPTLQALKPLGSVTSKWSIRESNRYSLVRSSSTKRLKRRIAEDAFQCSKHGRKETKKKKREADILMTLSFYTVRQSRFLEATL